MRRGRALRKRYGKRDRVRHVRIAADGSMFAGGKRVTWGDIHSQAKFTHEVKR